MLNGLFTFIVFLIAVACDGGPDATATPGPSSTPAATPTPVATLPPGVVTPVPFNLPVVQLTVESGATKKSVTAEVASTDPERQRGLMFRASMPEDSGMLFLFPRDTNGGFWMESTYLPLTIAYIDKDGVIVELKDGKPLDRTPLTPTKAYRNVLEMNQGWFARNGLGVGSVVKLPAGLPTAK